MAQGGGEEEHNGVSLSQSEIEKAQNPSHKHFRASRAMAKIKWGKSYQREGQPRKTENEFNHSRVR